MIEITVDDDELLNALGPSSNKTLSSSRNTSQTYPSDTTPIKNSSKILYTESLNRSDPGYNSNCILSKNSSKTHYKHGSGEFANNVKCICTSIVFIAIIIAVFIITFYKNPEMWFKI